MILFSEFIYKLNKKVPEDIVKICNKKDDFVINDVFSNSNMIKQDSAFVCLKGLKSDGHEFINESINNGCVLVICNKEICNKVPYIIVKNTRCLLGVISNIIYDAPCEKLQMYAVTGTNGKSTTTFIIKHILSEIGIKTGMLGTVIYDDGNRATEASRTTPEASDIQRYLHKMIENNCKACVMEVSSQGLCMGRIEGTLYDTGVFTNLSEEHLDYHGTMKSYFEAKISLFRKYMKKDWRVATNIDNMYGREIFNTFKKYAISYGIEDVNSENSISAKNIVLTRNGSYFDLKIGRQIKRVFSPLLGEFNIYNLLAAMAAVRTQHDNLYDMLNIIKNIPNIPGRFESFYISSGTQVIIDYAHTPYALLNLLSSVKKITNKKIISVFGHGGERFSDNRYELGKIASLYADKVIVTNDNPRNEDPLLIAYQIYTGIIKERDSCEVSIILDRRKAIETALAMAKSGDIVVVSGKGHENMMYLADAKIEYSDLDVLVSFCKKNGVLIL